MRFWIGVLAAVIVLASAPGASAGPAVPFVEGPDIPAATAPDHVLTVFENERFDGCAGKVAATRTIAVPGAPMGYWDRVILELTATPDGDPWDRLFSVSIGGVEVLRGTTPRTAFTVRKDITDYAWLWLLPPGGTADVTLELGTYVGAQLGTVKLELYSDEPTYVAYRGLGHPVGVFLTDSLNGDGLRLLTTASFPSCCTGGATVELTLSNHFREEARFFPRVFHVLVDGQEVAFARPMPYTYAILGFGNENANRACRGPGTSAFGDAVHPVMWWTAQRAADVAGVHLGVGEIPPYRAEVEDAALLSGPRTVEVVQEGGVDYWVTSLSFFLRECPQPPGVIPPCL